MKSKILQHIRANKPPALPLPELKTFPVSENLESRFREVLGQVGAKAIKAQEGNLAQMLDKIFPNRKTTVSTVPGLPSDMDLKGLVPHELKNIDLCILPAQIAVAENGALFLDERVMGHRVLPFITQHLVLVIKADAIVGNMHEAYDNIDLQASGFGVFIAGPSKTADIEQSLVIGAHGARSLTVFVVE